MYASTLQKLSRIRNSAVWREGDARDVVLVWGHPLRQGPPWKPSATGRGDTEHLSTVTHLNKLANDFPIWGTGRDRAPKGEYLALLLQARSNSSEVQGGFFAEWNRQREQFL